MAISFKLKYSASATPIETIQATDTSQTVSLVHSSIDKSIGGGSELACGATATNVKYEEYETTPAGVSLNTIVGDTITGIDFLIVKIKSAKDAAADDPNLFLDISDDSYPNRLDGVGDCCMLRLNGLAGADIKLKSTATTGLCNVDIMYGIAS